MFSTAFPNFAHRELPLDASSLATAPRLAFAIRQDPPLARPRPRELAIRLEEDRAHASLGRAPPADFCNTRHDARTHPFERSILAREFGGRSPCFTRARALATNPRCPRAIPLSRTSRTLARPLGWLVATSRTSYGGFRLRGRRGPRAPERRAHRVTGELSSSDVPSSTRVATSLPREELETPLVAPTWPRSPSAAAPRRATVSERPRCFAPLRNHRTVRSVTAPRRLDFLGARREIAPASDAPDRPSVTPPLTFP